VVRDDLTRRRDRRGPTSLGGDESATVDRQNANVVRLPVFARRHYILRGSIREGTNRGRLRGVASRPHRAGVDRQRHGLQRLRA
jgi:hypothetical protein